MTAKNTTKKADAAIADELINLDTIDESGRNEPEQKEIKEIDFPYNRKTIDRLIRSERF